MRGFTLFGLAFGFAVTVWSAGLSAEIDSDKIDRLILQLGSGTFAKREAAGRALEAIGTPALEALRKAARESEDAEVRLRASRLVDAVTRRSRLDLLDCTGDHGVPAEDVRQVQEAWARHLGRKVEETIEVAAGVPMTFVLVPPGKFLMGSPEGERDRLEDESLHAVTLTEPFDLGKTEVTQAQYEALAGKNPSAFQGAFLPVEQVSWEEARDWADRLTTKRGDRYRYRLPTEAEWEYACRGGRPSWQPFGIGEGRLLSSRAANFDGNYPYGGACKGPYLEASCGVAGHAANALGLHDMHGNVWEWCQDWHAPYPPGAVTNPTGPPQGSTRVFRGGSWNLDGRYCRAARRGKNRPGSRFSFLGFRLARGVPSGAR